MRKLFILSFFLPLMVWAQSSLPPCPEAGVKHNCFGTFTYWNGIKYVGEWRDDRFHGQGIFYRADGSMDHSGQWVNGGFTQSLALDTNRFPFNPSTQSVVTPPIDPGRAEPMTYRNM